MPKYNSDQCDATPFKYPHIHIISNNTKPQNMKELGIPVISVMIDQSFNFQGDLKRHKASEHEGVRYSCVQCNDRSFNYQCDFNDTKLQHMKELFINVTHMITKQHKRGI